MEKNSDEYYQHLVSQQDYTIRRLSAQGEELSRAPLDFDAEGIHLEPGTLALDENRNLVLSYSDEEGNNGVIAFSPEGQEAYRIQTNSWIYSLFCLRDGRIAVIDSGPEGMELSTVDAAAQQLGETFTIPSEVYDPIPGSGDYDFYYTSGVYLYGYDLAAGESVKILDWISCDVDSDSLGKVFVDNGGVIRAMERTWTDGTGGERTVTTNLITLEQKPADQLPQKTHLTLAVQYLDYDLRARIIHFNRHSDTCRIDVKEYSEYNTEDDYNAGLTKLTTEILAGDMPDLLVLDGLPYTQLASKGLLEDLYPYLDGDSELSREDFFENVLQAQEVNGGLYQACANFSISTVLGAESVVGGKPGWTYDQLYAALGTMPEGCEIFRAGTTKDEILECGLTMNMDSLVDWDTGECRFDSEDFLAILDFSNRFVQDYDWDTFNPENDGEHIRISQGRQMLMDTTLSMFSEMQMNAIYFGGGDNLCYIGYPTVDGSLGSAFRFPLGLAMSASCADKEAAWEFLRGFLTEDYQRNQSGLPTNRHEFERQLEEAMTPIWKKDAQGNILLDENGEKIEESRGGISFGDGTSSYDIYSMTQAQADKLMDLVENTAISFSENTQITKIVTDEAQAYFGGQKSAGEVAKLIQSKVNLYVNEQR